MATTKTDLIAALRKSGEDLLARVGTMDDAALSKGRYENGWTAKEILAHLASIEWTYKKLVDTAKQPRSAARPTGEEGRYVAPPPAGNPIDDYNNRQVARRAGKTAKELLLEFKENRDGTIAAVQSCSDDLLAQPTKSAGGAQGTLAEVINFVAVLHVQQHTKDLLGS